MLLLKPVEDCLFADVAVEVHQDELAFPLVLVAQNIPLRLLKGPDSDLGRNQGLGPREPIYLRHSGRPCFKEQRADSQAKKEI